MNEGARKERNQQRLSECFPAFAQRVEAVIRDLEDEGFRPRIQDAHRSIEDQLLAFKKGNSRVKFGFHNVTGSGGRSDALAVDLLDDDHPLVPAGEREQVESENRKGSALLFPPHYRFGTEDPLWSGQ